MEQGKQLYGAETWPLIFQGQNVAERLTILLQVNLIILADGRTDTQADSHLSCPETVPVRRL